MTHEIIEIYPMGRLPKTKAGKAAHAASWRRETAAEAAAKPAKAKAPRAKKENG